MARNNIWLFLNKVLWASLALSGEPFAHVTWYEIKAFLTVSCFQVHPSMSLRGVRKPQLTSESIFRNACELRHDFSCHQGQPC